MQPSQADRDSRLQDIEIYKHYMASQYLSVKHSSYFQVYEELLSKYRGKPITFVEIGVFNGGSLFMWRSYFGPQARIIGIDFNPEAKKWEKDGFEIFIGSQSDTAFWDGFFASVGDVDILVDDGGHTNEQQIITVEKCAPHIRDKGMLIVEDVHSSYMKSFGNPSRYSFINYTKRLIDTALNSRFPAAITSANPFRDIIYSIQCYESMVCFHIDRTKCFSSWQTSNNGITSDAVDYVYEDRLSQRVSNFLTAIFKPLGIKFSAKRFFRYFENVSVNRRLKKYFR